MPALSCARGRRLLTIEGGVCALAQLVEVGYEGFVHEVTIDAFSDVEQYFNYRRKADEIATLGRIAGQDSPLPTRDTIQSSGQASSGLGLFPAAKYDRAGVCHRAKSGQSATRNSSARSTSTSRS